MSPESRPVIIVLAMFCTGALVPRLRPNWLRLVIALAVAVFVFVFVFVFVVWVWIWRILFRWPRRAAREAAGWSVKCIVVEGGDASDVFGWEKSERIEDGATFEPNARISVRVAVTCCGATTEWTW